MTYFQLIVRQSYKLPYVLYHIEETLWNTFKLEILLQAAFREELAARWLKVVKKKNG